MTGLGFTLGVAIVLVLTVLQRVGDGFTFGVGFTPRLEMGFWLRLGVVFEFKLVEGCELEVEASCKLGLLVGTGTAGLGLACVSLIVAVVATGADTSVF